MSTLDLVLLACLFITGALVLVLPVRCNHPCAQCAADRVEAARLKAEREESARARSAAYAHDIGIDRAFCGLCSTYHCAHDGCPPPRK